MRNQENYNTMISIIGIGYAMSIFGLDKLSVIDEFVAYLYLGGGIFLVVSAVCWYFKTKNKRIKE